MQFIGVAYSIIHILMICINIFCILFMICYYISIQLYQLLN